MTRVVVLAAVYLGIMAGILFAAAGRLDWATCGGYVGTLLAFITVPVSLGLLWALLPASAGLSLLVVRTSLEDQTLQKELGGHSRHALRVRRRLPPGIW